VNGQLASSTEMAWFVSANEVRLIIDYKIINIILVFTINGLIFFYYHHTEHRRNLVHFSGVRGGMCVYMVVGGG